MYYSFKPNQIVPKYILNKDESCCFSIFQFDPNDYHSFDSKQVLKYASEAKYRSCRIEKIEKTTRFVFV